MIYYNEGHDLPSSYNYPLTNCTWQCVDKENQEDNKNKQNYANDDVLLVIPPDQVIQTLERVDKPREGCFWSAKGEERKRKSFVKADPSLSKVIPLQNIYLRLERTFDSLEPTTGIGGNVHEYHRLLGHFPFTHSQTKFHTQLVMKFQLTHHKYFNLHHDTGFKIENKMMINPKEEIQAS